MGDEVIINKKQELQKSFDDEDMDKLQKDAHSDAVNKVIQTDIQYAVAKKQIGTPTFELNGKFEMGIPKGGYPELKKLIEENGGKPKHKMF